MYWYIIVFYKSIEMAQKHVKTVRHIASFPLKRLGMRLQGLLTVSHSDIIHNDNVQHMHLYDSLVSSDVHT